MSSTHHGSPRHLLATAARLLLGLGFTITGANFFFHFLKMPPPPPGAMAFHQGLAASGYVMPVVMTTQLVAGLLLLIGRFVPLALALLAPVLVGIVAYHLALDPHGLALPGVMLALELITAWCYRGAFAPMLRARVAPTPRTHDSVAQVSPINAM